MNLFISIALIVFIYLMIVLLLVKWNKEKN